MCAMIVAHTGEQVVNKLSILLFVCACIVGFMPLFCFCALEVWKGRCRRKTTKKETTHA